ncbi:PQQ-binding-like beta-propeller repeat protein [Candidatus Magnetominusculus dajiuhuensis]|uniref:outer membrane protein assembly factor BamB family protein n=1 Tax=Candidatus Magnetominusculus dajiuhuensis TaxID=3137712 RepID=UPI003B43CE62
MKTYCLSKVTYRLSTVSVILLVLSFCLSMSYTSAATAASVSAWPMFHHDAQHSGQSANNGPLTNTLKWSFSPNSSANSANLPPDTPSISNDGLTLYVNVTGLNGVAGNQLVAINTTTGQKTWSYSIGGGGATAVAADGTIYAAGGTQLYAFTSAGVLKWVFSGANDSIHGEPCIGGDGTIYFGSWDTYVYAVNPDSSLKWKYKTVGSIAPLASPTLSTDGLTLYVGSGDPHNQTDGTIYAILTLSGNLKWSKNIDPIRASGAVVGQDGTIYVCGNKMVHAFTPDGTQLWQSASGTAEYLTPALSSSGIIYTGTGSTGKIFALSAATGATLWSYQTGVNPSYPNGPQYGVLSAPVIGADATVYLGSVDGKMYALKSDGTLRWTYTTSASIGENCPAIGADGTLYFSSSNTYLYAVKDNITSYTLSVSKSGTGTVTSSPSGISCGSTCSSAYTSGSSVVLSAAPATGSTFTSWTGCDNTSGSQCTVAMSSAKSVSAVFTATPSTYTLSVSKSGTGTGTVTSSPSGISCGSTCSAAYTSGTSVALSAAADNSSTFTSWSGCDNTSGSQCTVAMSSAKSVTATFTTSGSPDYNAASAQINAIYSQYASWFGTKSGGIVTGTSGSATYYYVQWFTNGAALVAWTDGTMFTYYNNIWYALGITWKALSDLATTGINAIYSQYASWFGTKSGSMLTGTSGSATYYVQWFTNGAALVAWTDGTMYTYYNSSWYALGVSWK